MASKPYPRHRSNPDRSPRLRLPSAANWECVILVVTYTTLMKTTSRCAALVLLCGFVSVSHAAPFARESADSKTIKIYKLSKHVTAPELMPIDFTTSTENDCQSPLKGDVEFAEIVDPSGNPRNVFATRPAGNELDQLAAEIAAKDRFKPGERNGTKVAVSLTINIQLEACKISKADAYGNAIPKVRLRNQPTQVIGPPRNFEPESLPLAAISSPTLAGGNPSDPATSHNAVGAPIPINTPEAKYTEEARKLRIEGVCLVSLIVDAYGNPQNIRVVRSIGHGLDEAAIEAVKNYRFRPAMKDGHPVAVMMTIEVNFRLR
jgi:TonB family protein